MVLLSACMRVNVDLTLNEDDTVDGAFIMAISDEAAELMGQDPASAWDEMSTDMTDGMPESMTEEPYAEDGYTGSRLVFEDTDISEFSSGMDDDLNITREGDEFVVTGVMDMSDTSGELAGVPSSILDSFEIRIAITFPGEVTEHTGTLDGTTVTWEPQIGEATEISARGEATAGALGGMSTALWVALAVVAVLVIAALAFFLLRKKRTPAAAGQQLPGQTAPYGAPQGQPAPHGQPFAAPQGQPFPGQPGPAPQGQPLPPQGAPYAPPAGSPQQPTDQPAQPGADGDDDTPRPSNGPAV